jgi:DNA-binding IclR family transcriptional regulator/sugar lactone lactonase YvrE
MRRKQIAAERSPVPARKTAPKSPSPAPEAEEHVVQGAQALQRGLALLDLIADSPVALRFSEIADRAGLSKGTVHRMLTALTESRLLAYDPAEQTYRLGVRLFEMAHRVWDSFDLRSAAEPELTRVSSAVQETVRLAILNGNDVLYIDQRETAQPIRLGNGVGSRVAVHASSAGKAILAHLPPAARHQLLRELDLARVTPNTITNHDVLLRELDLIKARGYAVSISEQTEGASSVAVPVLDHRSEPLGAIAVIGPTYRLSPERLHGLGPDLIAAARRVSANGGQIAMSLGATKPFAPASPQVRCAVPATAFLGKSPLWLADRARLLWVDILAPSIHLSDPATGEDSALPLDDIAGAIVPRSRGGFIAAIQNGFRALDLDGPRLSPIGPDAVDQTGMRLNDGGCDSAGRLWVGSVALDSTPGAGNLWRFDPDGRVKLMEKGFHVANGLGWSPDETRFYLADSNAQTVYAYDCDPASGALSNRRAFVSIPEERGKPDGLAVDAKGFVWVALWDGWALARYAPDGSLDRLVPLPVPRPASLAFGGDDLKTLFVTTARVRLSAQQIADAPLSGSILALPVGTPGRPPNEFGG